MRDDSVVTGLVIRARHGDQRAWDTLVERYAPLVWSICRSYRLSRADTDDVGQTVWLRLVAHLDRLRDPAALTSWITTTTRRECGKVHRAARLSQTAWWDVDAGTIPTQGPSRPTPGCWRPSAARWCARRSPACPPAASSCSPC